MREVVMNHISAADANVNVAIKPDVCIVPVRALGKYLNGVLGKCLIVADRIANHARHIFAFSASSSLDGDDQFLNSVSQSRGIAFHNSTTNPSEKDDILNATARNRWREREPSAIPNQGLRLEKLLGEIEYKRMAESEATNPPAAITAPAVALRRGRRRVMTNSLDMKRSART